MNPADIKLSDHFTLAEAIASATATARGIDNMPPAEIVPRLALVAREILEPIRAAFGPFAPTSFYRAPALNRAVNGAPGSQHMRGEAVDIVHPAVPNLELARWARDRLAFDQLILENWSKGAPARGWVHVSLVAPAGANRHMAGTYAGGVYDWRGLP